MPGATLRPEMAVQVRLLDAPVVTRDGHELHAADLGGPRAVRCLAVLAVQAGRSVSREVLAEAVWEDGRPSSWRANLRALVSDLRRALGDDAVVRTTDGYRLDVPRTAVDVLALEQHASDAAAADAGTAWQLATQALPSSGAVALRGFDGSWSDRLRADVADTCRRLKVRSAAAALELGLARDAERLARELVATFPLREDGHRLLMRALAASGNTAAALAAYDACRRLLDEQVGARPSPETQEVFLGLLRGSDAPAPPPVPETLPPRRPVQYLLTAAHLAFDAGVFDDCARAAAAGLAALDTAGEDAPGVRARLQVLLAAAEHQLGDPAGAALLEHLIDDARGRGDGAVLADAALAFTASESGGAEIAVDEAKLDLYREALAAVAPDDRVRRARLLSRIAFGLSWRVDYAAGRAAAAEAVDLAEATGDPAVLLSALSSARRILTGSGELDAQAEVEARLDEVATAANDAAARAKTAAWTFATAAERGEGNRLDALIEAAERHAADVRAGPVLHFIAFTRAALTLLRGDLPRAAANIEHAASLGRRTGLAPHVVEALRLVQLVAYWDAVGQLGAHRDEVVAAFSALAVPQLSGMVAIAEAATGDLDVAHAHLATFLDHWCTDGPSLLASVALAVQVADTVFTVGDPEQAARLYPLLARYAGQGAYIAHFVGPVDTALGALALTTGDHATASRHLEVAARLAAQVGAPLAEARCRALAGHARTRHAERIPETSRSARRERGG